MDLISPAFASTGAAPRGFDLMGLLAMFAIFALFWLLMVRPQQKRFKEHQKMLSGLKKSDEVATQGGIVGRVTKIGEQFLMLEIASGVEITVQRGSIAVKLEKGTLKSS